MPAPKRRPRVTALAWMAASLSLLGWVLTAAAGAPGDTDQNPPVEGTSEAEQTIPRGAKELFYDPLDRSVVSTSGECSATIRPVH